MPDVGTQAAPLRVAIIGSGPSGFYAADALLKQKQYTVEVDLFDRLPTPYGLVRGGVAPDHQKIKEVTRAYERTAENPQFRFYGNVEFGTDFPLADLKAHYHAVIYAVGAQTDKRLGIPGEDLPGSHAATEFVAWYNAHPDYRDCTFDLTGKRVAVIGNGNVAMDVARILARSEAELRQTDIADYALDALSRSNVTEIVMLGRRGPAQAAFTHKELKEFGELAISDIIVDPIEGRPDPVTQEWLKNNHDAEAEKNLAILEQYINQTPISSMSKPRRIIMRFLVSPVEIVGDGKVEAIKLVKNRLEQNSDGSLRARATDETEFLPIDLVFRSIGYMGVPLPDVPFDSKAGVIPNQGGRVFDPTGQRVIVGEYCAGWIKRGPSGVIGDNRKDANDTIARLLEDIPSLPALDPASATRASVEALLARRKPDYVTFEDWKRLDQAELANGAAIGRPRLKYSRVAEMIGAIKAARQPDVS
jgi:ferredoxin/flavodoxin---NADP+ reductase